MSIMFLYSAFRDQSLKAQFLKSFNKLKNKKNNNKKKINVIVAIKRKNYFNKVKQIDSFHPILIVNKGNEEKNACVRFVWVGRHARK